MDLSNSNPDKNSNDADSLNHYDQNFIAELFIREIAPMHCLAGLIVESELWDLVVARSKKFENMAASGLNFNYEQRVMLLDAASKM